MSGIVEPSGETARPNDETARPSGEASLATEAAPPPVLEVRGLGVARRGAAILDDLAFSIGVGECLAIVGESGAGKSVLARTLLGLTQPEPDWTVRAERFDLDGSDMRGAGRRRWRSLRGSTVALILQDALQSLDPLRPIEAEVGETLAIRGTRGARLRTAVIRALEAARLPAAASRLRQRSGELSGGMRQRVLIASALIGQPRLVIADEPTTALDPATAARISELFEQIKARGSALLLISHDLESVARTADRVAVLDGGRIVETGTAQELLSSPRHAVTRTLVESMPRGPKPTPTPEPGRELIALTGVSRRFRSPDGGTTGLGEASRGVDFGLRAGEAVGVVGESGAGKTTLARILVGAERADRGEVRIDPDCRIRLIPQDPLATFDPRWRVERILSASNRRAGIAPARLLAEVGLDAALLTRRPANLSGGQRQRVAIARALAADPDVLVCDEPVSALDVSTQAGILDLLRGLQAERGLSLVFVSHDLAAVRTVCDRVLVMRDGLIVEQGPTERVLGRSVEP